MDEAKVLEALNSWLEKLQNHVDHDFKTNYLHSWTNGQTPQYTQERSKKWFKIWRGTKGGQISIFAMVDPSNGNIYKANTPNSVAKGVRANLFDEKLPLEGGQLYRYR
jgi:hypothetical protein